MVKPDVKHNYYQDLDLPTTASVDDVRKAYRKLALQYHPDRNAGREEECVPRFQAIQAASEILSDPTSKAKYDADRRKAGLYPTSAFKPSVPTPGNPYAARSDFPPPPRRTQPGTWQRPQPGTPGPTPTGADRFASFPRPGGAAPQKNPAADRAQQFRAWQNMNNPARPQYNPQQPPQVPPREPQAANSPRPGAAPTSNRPRMGRQDTKMPTEEQIRAGMRHGKSQMPQMPVDEEAAQRQTAWQAFNNSNAGKPGVKPRKPPATPRRAGGFDPNAPGSDERPAPASSHYVHRHKSEDFTAGGFPPPPPGPPPTSVPQSPTSPNSARAYGDPLRQFRSRNSNEDVPFAEGTPRTSTPYSSAGRGEKTQFSSEGLRRSASTRDTTRLSGGTAGSTSSARARSVDPATRQREADRARSGGSDGKPAFIPGMYSDSSSAVSTDSEDITETPEDADSSTGPTPAPRDIKDRPMRKPAPPSRRFNGSASPFPSAPGDGAIHTDSEQPSMQQRKKSNNMYDTPFIAQRPPPSSFSRGTWVHNAFGSGRSADGKPRKPSIPHWAFPSSMFPSAKQSPRPDVNQSVVDSASTTAEVAFDAAKEPVCEQATTDEQKAFDLLRSKLSDTCPDVETLNQLDFSTFRIAVDIVRSGHSTGMRLVDDLICDVLAQYPAVEHASPPKKLANEFIRENRFSFPIDNDTFTPTSAKSRSAEEINMNFSPGTWHGKFNGSGPDYFTDNARRPSPGRRKPSSRSAHGRAATTDPTPASTSPMPPPPLRPTGSDTGSTYTSPLDAQGFDKDAWQFKDSSWAWPPPPPNPPASKPPSRKGSRHAARSQSSNRPDLGTSKNPHVVDDDDNVIEVDRSGVPINGTAGADDLDAMDIDSPPHQDPKIPLNSAPAGRPAKEPRLYSVPPSAWRQSQAQGQQQQQQQNNQHQTQHHRQTSSANRRAERQSAESNFNVNLDDLSHTEPFARNTNGLKNLADLSSTLPFDSRASSTLPTRSMEPQKLQLPKLPKIPEAPSRLSKASWQEYAQVFSKYVYLYHMFNSTMIKHFATREEEAKTLISSGMDWLAATGDPVNGIGGFGSYYKAVKEDEQVRETWNLGSEKHLEAVKAFESMRERVRERASNGTLPEV